MAEPAFSPEIEKALGCYAVPLVPAGFSDRLMARISGGDTGASDAANTLPPLRSRRANPWHRASRIIGSVAIFSLATATAAAAGVFGDPVYMPGISEALVEAKIVEAPAPVTKPKLRIVAEPRVIAPTAAPPATGSAAIVSRVTELRDDPEYAKLPPRERLKLARKEVRQLVRSGEASKQDVREAVRELAKGADPATRDAWRKAAAQRREKRLERREALRNATPEERAAMLQELRERRRTAQNEAPPE